MCCKYTTHWASIHVRQKLPPWVPSIKTHASHESFPHSMQITRHPGLHATFPQTWHTPEQKHCKLQATAAFIALGLRPVNTVAAVAVHIDIGADTSLECLCSPTIKSPLRFDLREAPPHTRVKQIEQVWSLQQVLQKDVHTGLTQQRSQTNAPHCKHSIKCWEQYQRLQLIHSVPPAPALVYPHTPCSSPLAEQHVREYQILYTSKLDSVSGQKLMAITCISHITEKSRAESSAQTVSPVLWTSSWHCAVATLQAKERSDVSPFSAVGVVGAIKLLTLPNLSRVWQVLVRFSQECIQE